MSSRHFENEFKDFHPSNANDYLDDSLRDISDNFRKKIAEYEKIKLNHLVTDLRDDIYSCNTVFTGSAGIAYLFYLHSKLYPENAINILRDAAKYVRIEQSRRPRVTFLCGEAGPLALGAVISDRLGADRPKTLPDALKFAQQLQSLSSVATHKSTPDELLYGRVGYLYALLFLNKETQKQYIPPPLITNVIESILQSGVELASQPDIEWKIPLLYEWHNSFYLGGAHGVAGILYLLLQAREYLKEEHISQLIHPTLEWLLSLRYKGGNLPSSLGSNSDRLVQWCHGAPGVVQLCCLAYEIFGDEKYLDAAKQFGEVVWARGLCTKGYSICHGVAGNAYTFLQLFQTTKDPRHLYRACCFADYCIKETPGTEQHKPDSPASLFEGLAGQLYFMADIKNPTQAKFPGFTL